MRYEGDSNENKTVYRLRLSLDNAHSICARTKMILFEAVPFQTEFNLYWHRLDEAEYDTDAAIRLHNEVADRLRARLKAGFRLPDRLPKVEDVPTEDIWRFLQGKNYKW